MSFHHWVWGYLGVCFIYVYIYIYIYIYTDGSDANESACNEGELGLIPGLGRSPEEGNGCPIQFSCLKNPVDRGSWWPIVHGITKESDTAERLILSFGYTIIISLHFVGVCSLYIHFLESFYCKGSWILLQAFSCIYWDDHIFFYSLIC